MIIFDTINIFFKYWSMLEFCYLNSAVRTKRIKILVKGCNSFRNREFWWNLDWYFIDHFSSFWYEQYFWVESNLFFFNLFRILMMLFYEIHKLFFCLFENLIRCSNLDLEFSLKVIIRRWMFRGNSNHFNLNKSWWKILNLSWWLPVYSINYSYCFSKLW